MPNKNASRELLVPLGNHRGYRVIFTSLSDVPRHLFSLRADAERCVVITDENVDLLYGNTLRKALDSAGLQADTITLPAGESTKSMAYLQHVYDRALTAGVERDTFVLALGGGVVGDLAGFAAATLLRGLPFIQVPTTLVAQVDSSIGGKTGVNHSLGKNLIGAFHQPSAVLVDTSLLQSLPERQWLSGMSEVIKHGLIADESLVNFLETWWDDIAAQDPDVVAKLIPHAARVKASIVSEDERETGRRIILNFGHTFGHALEKVTGYGTFTHGEAVAAGMRAAIHLSHAIHPAFDTRRADELASQVPIPLGIADLDVPDLMDAMKSDKKTVGGRVRLVLLRRIGEAYATSDVDRSDIEAAWRFMQEVTG